MTETLFSNENFTDNSNESFDDVRQNQCAATFRVLNDSTDTTTSTEDYLTTSSPVSYGATDEECSPSSDSIVPNLRLTEITDDSFDLSHLKLDCQQEAYKDWLKGKK